MTDGKTETLENQYPAQDPSTLPANPCDETTGHSVHYLALQIDGVCGTLNGHTLRYDSSGDVSDVYRGQLVRDIRRCLDEIRKYLDVIDDLIADDIAGELGVEDVIAEGGQ